MKIIISEHQLKTLISESYDQNRLDYLLDKINAVGLNSLTDKEKKTLNNISLGVDDEEEEPYDKPISPEYVDRGDRDIHTNSFDESSDLLGMFMFFASEFQEININNSTWYVEAVETNDSEKFIHVANENTEFYVIPFLEDSNHITIETTEGRKFRYIVKTPPANEKEMKIFIKSFYSTILPKIIEKVV